MTTNSTDSTKAKPVYRKLLPNGISTAVFENEYEGRKYRSVNLQRSYKKDGQWKRMSMYIDHEHIPFVIEALQGTWNFLNSSAPSQVEADELQPEASA
ncbi:MAG: hypothetical protein IT422_15780 [Pirellulaceae bacterium]|nr:hypothetical protein [Pirellulaceae bacterium]